MSWNTVSTAWIPANNTLYGLSLTQTKGHLLLRSITKELLAPRVSSELGYPKQIQGFQCKAEMQNHIKTKTKHKRSENQQKHKPAEVQGHGFTGRFTWDWSDTQEDIKTQSQPGLSDLLTWTDWGNNSLARGMPKILGTAENSWGLTPWLWRRMWIK